MDGETRSFEPLGSGVFGAAAAAGGVQPVPFRTESLPRPFAERPSQAWGC